MSKLQQHEIVARLIDLANELGRTPTREEFKKHVRRAQWEREFGNYAALVLAAGLKLNVERNVDSSIFKASIDKHLDRYVEPAVIPQEPFPTAALISDIHWPFSSARVVGRFHEYVGDVKPEFVIINGDAWDMYSHTKFPRTHNLFTPREEQDRSRAMNEEFWKTIQKNSPKSKCVQLLGNHDVRPMKRILESYPEAEDWIAEKLRQLFTFEGVTTEMDARKELFLNANTIVFHGYRSKLGDHRDFTLYNTFNGHTHMGGVVFRKVRGSVLFECNSGFAGDPEAKGLTYTPQKLSIWTPGFAALDKLGPRFISV